MAHVTIPVLGAWPAWRDAARGLLVAEVPPESVTWAHGEAPSDLFALRDAGAPPPSAPASLTVPRAFVHLAETVVWHRDPERFARLYTLLWRLRTDPALLGDRADPALAKLREMEKSVRRDRHKMTAFVRFRDIGEPDRKRRRFAAWFEPTHYITEPTAPFFVRRFGDMDWLIATPHCTARFEDGALTLADGSHRPDMPEDATEALWTTYFRSIFNPARLKVDAMRAEMPKKYWRNLPEARFIPDLIAGAGRRAEAMRAAQPTLPPSRAERILSRMTTSTPTAATDSPEPLAELRQAIAGCTRCSLYCSATQAVPGEGPQDARLMFVGEQPGDEEDLVGRPFVGPAGKLFDQVAERAGLDRGKAYVTNAVKHFKFKPRGKRRIHQRPNAGEVQACKWWLDLERRIVKPDIIVALGSTAALATTGSGDRILARQGSVEHTDDGTAVLTTIHPSYLLRLPDQAAREEAEARFQKDLETALARLEADGPGGLRKAG